MKHPSCTTHYGSSPIMCIPVTYSSCHFMPIQRLFKRCAYGKLDVALRGHATEQVIVAMPIILYSLKLYYLMHVHRYLY